MIYYTKFDTPFCRVFIAATEGNITNLKMQVERKDTTPYAPPEYWQEDQNEEVKILREAAAQVNEYFKGARKEFSLPVAPSGTSFQNKVWEQLRLIPYGEVRSYKEIAIAVGNEKASRAVGLANNKNPIPLIIPCHRVIGSDGSLTGFASGVDFKRRLLSHENKEFADLK